MRRDKLLDTKWTVCLPVDRDKHFVVRRLIREEGAARSVGSVELEALLSRRRRVVSCRELEDRSLWQPGWR